ncbi:MAG TPA: sodium-dependent transporter [Candidatus Blautia faecigallinarum]|uniref:Transporter n=1 Tax=Candidatus Blautia faecigallinarum TaxID=2838488 RepID=A0A9D2DPY9_9FIRM|nr:sodium-dependent transporter [Candidatus Blautia faecigallinarum]
MENQRSSFTNKLGFVLAAAGSAVGLGNLWRFPYLAAKYGGGIFLLVYLILVVTFGFSLMITEIAIGRKTRLSVIGAYQMLDKRFKGLGYLSCVVPFIITPYYCVIGGWVLKYFVVFLTGQAGQAANDTFFSEYTAQAVSPVIYFLIYALVGVVIVWLGVDSGIEKASRFMMPLLIIMTIFIAVFSVMQPGALEGVIYYLKPDFSRFNATTVLAAMGQLFYSMSLAMGIMITYGSYMKKEDHLETSVRQIELFDTGVAFMAGLMIIPAVFAFSGGSEEALGKGPSLMFVTMPKVFESMAFGTVVGCIFFLLVLFAALTSSISLTETLVSIVTDKFGWSRKKGCAVITLFIVAVGVPVSLGFGVLDFIAPMGMTLLDFFDFISNSVLMPIVAFLTCIFVGYFVKPKMIIDEVEINGPFKIKRFYTVLIKYIAPVCLIAILIFAVMETTGMITV